jgi:hypothetical protein
MKGDFSYQCGSCQELLSRVSQGVCPVCGSRSVFPTGWYQLSVQERSAWFRRIRGEDRKSPSRTAQLLDEEID